MTAYRLPLGTETTTFSPPVVYYPVSSQPVPEAWDPVDGSLVFFTDDYAKSSTHPVIKTDEEIWAEGREHAVDALEAKVSKELEDLIRKRDEAQLFAGQGDAVDQAAFERLDQEVMNEKLRLARENVERQRERYVQDIAATYEGTFHKADFTKGDGAKRAGKIPSTATMKRIYAKNSEDEYVAAIGLIERYMGAQVLQQYGIENLEASGIGLNEALEREQDQVIARELWGTVDATTGDYIEQGEAGRLNALVSRKLLERSGHYTFVEDASGQLAKQEKVGRNWFSRKLLALEQTWHDWSSQGVRGHAKKAATGFLLGAGATLGSAITLGLGAVGSVGVAIAMRLSRSVSIQRLDKKSNLLRAEKEQQANQEKYAAIARHAGGIAANAGGVNRPEPASYDLDHFAAIIKQDFSERASQQAKQNRRRAYTTGVLVLGGGTLGHLFAKEIVGPVKSVWKTIFGHKFGWQFTSGDGHGGPYQGAHETHAARTLMVHPSPSVAPSAPTQLPSPEHTASAPSTMPPAPKSGHTQLGGGNRVPAHHPKKLPGQTAKHSGNPNSDKHHHRAVTPRAKKPVTVHLGSLHKEYVSQVYTRALGQHRGMKQMQHAYQAALAHHELVKVNLDPHNPGSYYYELTKKGAKVIGKKAVGSSNTSDVVRVLAKNSNTLKLAA